MYYEYLPIWFGVVILIREVSISVLMVVATALGMERFPVTRLGKWATFALMAAVPWITLGSAGGAWTVFTYMGWAVGIPGVFVSYKSFFQYLPSVRSHLASGRKAVESTVSEVTILPNSDIPKIMNGYCLMAHAPGLVSLTMHKMLWVTSFSSNFLSLVRL